MSRIAFIGLGHMGSPMALNLIKAGYSLSVFDLVADSAAALGDAGARVASSAADAVHGCDVVISMLPASKHVESLYLGDEGLLQHIDADALIIECSTIAPQSAIKVSKAAEEKGLRVLDAPVSGGTAGAAAGTLTSSKYGEKHLPCRRIWRRASCQNMQQHAVRRINGRNRRSFGFGCS